MAISPATPATPELFILPGAKLAALLQEMRQQDKKDFMGPQVVPVASDSACPTSADVVIVGGGIIGTASALYLSRRGLKVVLCEKGHIAGEQSSRNWGWCRQAKRDPREFDLIREALRLWRGMDAEIGADTGFTTTGIMFSAGEEAKEAYYAAWVKEAAGAGIHAEMLTSAQAAHFMPATPCPRKRRCGAHPMGVPSRRRRRPPSRRLPAGRVL